MLRTCSNRLRLPRSKPHGRKPHSYAPAVFLTCRHSNRAASSPGEVAALILGEPGASLCASGLYRKVKAAFLEMASAVPASDTAASLVPERASSHWLRHLVDKTLVIDEQVSLRMAAALPGHESVVITVGYCQTDLSRLREIMQSCRSHVANGELSAARFSR
jgi:hypothetical protein